MKKLYGVTAAMVTPFTAAGEVDHEALSALTKTLLAAGVNGLYPCGTTGEMVHLTGEERMRMAETVVKAADGNGTVFLHCGAMQIEETKALLRHASSIGADGAGVVTPMFLSADEREMEAYYTELSDCVPADFPIYLYNIPQCSGNDLTAACAARISRNCPNVTGIKYSYPDMLRTLEYLNVPGLGVLHGCDKLFSSLLMMGCAGTVSGVAGVFPEPFVKVWNAWNAQDILAMQHWQRICIAFCDLLRCGSNMSYFKEALRMRGLPVGGMRRPQQDLGKEQIAELEEKLRALCTESGVELRFG